MHAQVDSFQFLGRLTPALDCSVYGLYMDEFAIDVGEKGHIVWRMSMVVYRTTDSAPISSAGIMDCLGR